MVVVLVDGASVLAVGIVRCRRAWEVAGSEQDFGVRYVGFRAVVWRAAWSRWSLSESGFRLPL
jgi:hypothetical protein